jgi:putative heme-binding domain-containing protein
VAQIAAATHDESLEPQLLAALNVPASADTRAVLAATLLAFNPRRHLAVAAELLYDQSAPIAARQKIAQAMNEVNLGDARTNLAEAIRIAPERNQPKLAVILAATRPGAEFFLGEVEAGRLSARLLQDRTVKEKLVAAQAMNAQARISALTSKLTPLNAELQKQIDLRRASYSPQAASAARGAAIFDKTCGVCHQIDGKGAVVGPQLDGIGARGVDRIMEDIIDPNRNVDSAFRTTMFVLADGDVVSGLFRREEGQQIVYADSTGKEISLAKKEIKEKKPSELSLMPEGLAEGMTPQEFNDLIAFLLTKNGAKK